MILFSQERRKVDGWWNITEEVVGTGGDQALRDGTGSSVSPPVPHPDLAEAAVLPNLLIREFPTNLGRPKYLIPGVHELPQDCLQGRRGSYSPISSVSPWPTMRKQLLSLLRTIASSLQCQYQQYRAQESFPFPWN